jgi:hypothetical protein
VKDKLEDRLHSLVCSGGMRIEDAQQAIAQDWIAERRPMASQGDGSRGCLGSWLPLQLDSHPQIPPLPDHHMQMIMERAFHRIEPQEKGLRPAFEDSP